MASNSKSDVGFAFDPTPFLNGLKRMETGIGNLTKATVKGSKDMGQGFAWAMAKSQMMASALMGIGKGFVKVINKQIPEIGQAFGVAKDIIFKNLLWPLRQTLVPLLQKMLSWIKDNRGMFLQWGQVIANVFNVGIKVAGVLWNSLKSVASALLPILGAAKGGLGDAINLVVAKIAVVAEYISILMKPIIGGIADFVTKLSNSSILGDIINFAVALGKTAWGAATSFFSGLEKWITPALAGMDGIVKAISAIWENVFGKGGNNLNGFFNFLGNAAGFTITGVLTTIAAVLDGINKTIQDVKLLWDQMFNGGKGADALGIDAVKEALKKAASATNAAGVQKIIEDTYKNLAPSVQFGFRQALATMGQDFVTQFNAGHKSKIGMTTTKEFPWPFGSGAVSENLFKEAPAAKDGVIQGGKPVATDPKDVIIAHKGQVTVSKDYGPSGQGTWTINLNVTEGNATQAGKNFADGLQYQMRSLLAHESMIGGR